MKKFLIIFGLILSMTSLAYATMFCCPPEKTKEECCAERGKMYCENENVCRTRCRDVTPPECIGGCINPEGVCCTWCPTAEVCAYKGLCQRIVDGCYICVECPEPNPCPAPQCMNEEEVCCDSCPRTCPAGKKECGWNRCCSLTEECCGGFCYNPEIQECCNDEIKENCTINGQTRNPTTCECECLDKMIVCGESCVTAPSPVIENCEKLSDDGCEIVSACTEGQVCCGGCVKISRYLMPVTARSCLMMNVVL